MNDSTEKELKNFRTSAWIVYILYLAGVIFPLVLIVVGVIIAHINLPRIREKYPNIYLTSHFLWQIKTFWLSFLGYVIGGVTVLILIGVLILFVVFIWYLYRTIKGMIALSNEETLPNTLL